jgi:hypothetical protein
MRIHLAILSCALSLAAATRALAEGTVDDTPALPEGTVRMYVPDPVLPNDSRTPEGFGCFGACGPSCDCVDRVDAEVTTHEEGRACRWQTISCKTHSFCEWHDSCYRSCDFQVPGAVGDGRVARGLCYRSCDLACTSGNEPSPLGGWNPPEISPGPPPEALGLRECVARLTAPSTVTYDGVITYAQLIGCTPTPDQ